MVASPFAVALSFLSALPWPVHRAGSSPGSRVGRRKELEPQWRLWEGATRFIRREVWIVPRNACVALEDFASSRTAPASEQNTGAATPICHATGVAPRINANGYKTVPSEPLTAS